VHVEFTASRRLSQHRLSHLSNVSASFEEQFVPQNPLTKSPCKVTHMNNNRQIAS